MAYNERLKEILTILTKLKSVSVQMLTERINVSEVTIRKDLKLLEEKGKLIRTHGGAVLAEDQDHIRTFSMRTREFLSLKREIARKAKSLLHEDDTIYIDAGTTCALLADEIKDMSMRVVTNSLDVLLKLSSSPQISLFSLGGSLRMEAGSFIGPFAIDTLKNFQIQTCFMGTSGISRDGKFSSQNTIEAQLKKLVLESSKRKIILADHSKFDISEFSIFAKPENIDVLITDSKFTEIDLMRTLGIEVITA